MFLVFFAKTPKKKGNFRLADILHKKAETIKNVVNTTKTEEKTPKANATRASTMPIRLEGVDIFDAERDRPFHEILDDTIAGVLFPLLKTR